MGKGEGEGERVGFCADGSGLYGLGGDEEGKAAGVRSCSAGTENYSGFGVMGRERIHSSVHVGLDQRVVGEWGRDFDDTRF